MSVHTRDWDFDYAPPPTGSGDEGEADHDLVLATADDIDPAHVVEALANVVPDVAATPLFSGHPIFWTRIESSQPIHRESLARRLAAMGTSVRYVVSARRGSQRLPPLIDFGNARRRHPTDWMGRPASTGSEEDTPWRWFLRREGADVTRASCGTGAGTRLAIIDNDGRDLDRVELDAEVTVGVSAVPRAASHTAFLLGWAIGAKRVDGSRFRGIAPDASARFYCIPKAADEIVSLPLAVVRAVDDGADVVVCATYIEGLMSPLMDDALEFAVRLGRGGKGTAVVFPTGREMSSPANSIHSSLSLGMADPASDPRVFCVGPSSRDGRWFLWRDKHGRRRPFANRGPAVRWLAPGDDMANPFAADDRAGHAESSGASAIAAGVLLLTIACNPDLDLMELDAFLTSTCSPIDGAHQGLEAGLADPFDLQPLGTDADRHNAKHGYGKIDATAACLAARDPLALALVRMGEVEAASRLVEGVVNGTVPSVYAHPFARWAARTAMRDARILHALTSIARAIRLECQHPERANAQPPGHLLRHCALVVRLFLQWDPGLVIASELRELDRRVREILENGNSRSVESTLLSTIAAALGWGEEHNQAAAAASSKRTSGTRVASRVDLQASNVAPHAASASASRS